ncbi:MAG TPA: YbhB/YbcL family Raf kinase inhibitor-like protein [Rhizomicrobium sp.]|nr:YbhB/YbcL family Raf kinase inhibitor-like protein [Rhizomicrobium sp.]
MRNAGLALLLLAGSAWAQAPVPPPANPMVIESPSFADGSVIPDRYSMLAAQPVSPAFHWSNAPAATVSFTLILHDGDSLPRPGFPDNLHWLMFNIPATVHELPEGVPAVAQAADGTIQGRNGSRKVGYLPLGARIAYHHYVAELFALDTRLALGPDATRADVLAAMEGHVIAKAAYEGRFHR